MINSSTSGFPEMLLCHITVIIFHFKSYKLYSFKRVTTALAVAGIKSINQIEDNQVKTHHNQSISLSGATSERSSALCSCK
ncbi:hypothetical protein J5751_06150 [bacterium]|nr:hypothetical protein [bacterium]